MGLAASQARLLLLTARKSDLELRAQQITNTEMILAMQTEKIAQEYSNKISNKVTMMQTSTDMNDATYNQSVIMTYEELIKAGYTLQYANGDAYDNEGNSTAWLQDQIQKGDIIILSATTGEEVGITGSSNFYQTYYTEDDDAATAEYESKMAQIQTKEKKLQIDLNQIENQQKACDTEIDSVKKVIEKNIERTFKTFA
ncbi:TPA: hypothetical protein IAD52_06950 [Candidatus Spyradomonas excrementavium]|nr:hypothetical protein [Candidatus Spyradomonas excrementavium]